MNLATFQLGRLDLCCMHVLLGRLLLRKLKNIVKVVIPVKELIRVDRGKHALVERPVTSEPFESLTVDLVGPEREVLAIC